MGIADYARFHYVDLHDSHPVLEIAFDVVDIIMFSGWTVGWMIGSQIFFFYIHISLSIVYNDSCKSFSAVIGSRTVQYSNFSYEIHQFRLMRANYCVMRDKLEDMLSLFPFLWYGQMFLETSARVLKFMEIAGNGDAETWVNLFDYAMPIVGLIVMAVRFDSDVLEQQRLEKKIRNTMMSLNEPTAVANLKHEINGLLFEMNQDTVRSPTAWNFFNIDKRMILSYAGALLPFTIMLVNLGDMKHRIK
ncbi:hypothetical protein HDE_06973 [Halotydeus destructor]|nr:hypothetical protein HDE_06973 [Halotydeus destructor]